MDKAFVGSLSLVAQALGEKFGINVVFGSSAKTNGKTIFLPQIPADDPEAITLARGYLDHESAHVRITDFASTGNSPMEHQFTNIFEDIRIELDTMSRYPGSKRNLRSLVKVVYDRGEGFNPPNADSGPDAAIFMFLLTRMRFRFLSNECLKDSSEQWEKLVEKLFPRTLKDGLDSIIDRAGSMQSTADASQLAREVIDLIRSEQEEQENKQQQNQSQDQSGDDQETDQSGPGESSESDSDDDSQDDSNSETGDSSDDSSSQEGEDSDQSESSTGGSSDDSSDESDEDDSQEGTGGSSDKSDQDEDSSSNGSSGEPDDQSEDDSGNEPESGSGNSSSDGSGDRSGQSQETDSNDVQSGKPSDEDDKDPSQMAENLRQASQDADTSDGDIGELARKMLEEASDDAERFNRPTVYLPVEVDDYSDDGYRNSPISKSDVRAETMALRKRLVSKLIAQKLVNSNPGRTGRRIDNRSLHRLRHGDSRIFRKKRMQEGVNTGVVITLDQSFSMARDSRHVVATKSCLALALALEGQTGIQLSVGGYSNRCLSTFPYEDEPYVHVYKTPSKRCDYTDFRPVADGQTPTQSAIWWGVAQLQKMSGITRQLIINITDGQPNDIHATEHAVRFAQSAGVEIIGIGIGMPIDKAQASKSVMINDIKDLPKEVFTIIERELVSKAA